MAKLLRRGRLNLGLSISFRLNQPCHTPFYSQGSSIPLHDHWHPMNRLPAYRLLGYPSAIVACGFRAHESPTLESNCPATRVLPLPLYRPSPTFNHHQRHPHPAAQTHPSPPARSTANTPSPQCRGAGR